MLSEFMKPLAQKRNEIMSDKAYIEKIVEEGNEKAREAAGKTMEEVRKAIKF